MLKNYLTIVWRHSVRNTSFSIINVAGLAIGLTAFLAIGLYVADEWSYDRFHANKDRIYRAIIAADFDGQINKWGGAPNLLATTATREIPEVEKAARYFHHNFGDISFLSTTTEKFAETNLFYADPELLDIFDVALLRGSKDRVLSRPNTVMISESTAAKYFKEKDPIGQSIGVDNELQLEVTGVYRDFPSHSFLQAKLIASFASNWFGQDKNQSWGNASFDTFFLLREGVPQATANAKIEDMLARNISADRRWYTISLQPLLDIRLHSGELNSTFDRRNYGDAAQVKILMALAIIVLLIAAVNYMNLSTAQSQKRNKEVGVAKTLGATLLQLSGRFYAEAAWYVGVAMSLTLVLFVLLLPVFNSLSGKNIDLNFFVQPAFWGVFLLVWLSLTAMAGAYPAWYLSSFSPKSILQKTAASKGQTTVRKGLVIFQFSISMVLIICTVVFFQQMSFIRNKKLGYQPEQVIAVMTTAAKADQALAVKTAYEGLPEVKSVARTQSYPGIGTSMRSILREGDTGDGQALLTTRATHEVLATLNIALLAGSTLPLTKEPSDTTIQVIINESTANYLGVSPEDAIGKRVNIQGFDTPTEVVGVAEDFHYSSLHQQIGAFCFHNGNRTEPFNYLLVKVETDRLTDAMAKLQAAYQAVIPSAFEYTFLDQHLKNLYRAEENLSQVVLLFAGLAIFVACLGLYALAAFMAEQRTKEIGIRKVMGASELRLVGMLSQEFLWLVAIAFVIGIPLGYYVMDRWLTSFAYRT
ncbi:MAG: ABC transporter permease, partial [Cyclobacteriaceae bacterium]|nr:ABC transporter permease [Cyclobacteriaceae bacterium]